MNAAAADNKQVTVTLMRSVHGQLRHIASSVRGLGLRGILDFRQVEIEVHIVERLGLRPALKIGPG